MFFINFALSNGNTRLWVRQKQDYEVRVLIVSTSEKTGGAAVAANRLCEALNNNGVKAKMLVRDKETEDITVAELPRSWKLRWNFLWERWCIFLRLHLSRKNLFAIDIANAGTDITRLPEFKEANVIHLHWVNQGMLSLKNIRKIIDSKKPVVWTMHDIWPATAICHITLGCRKFTSTCHHCKYLPGGGGDNDLSATVWQQKKKAFKGKNICFVTCSRWLETEAKASALLKGEKITSIPNPINTHVFTKTNQHEARQQLGLPGDKKILLFVSQRATNRNKGMDYLVAACQQLAQHHPEMKEKLAIAILGGHSEEVIDDLPFKAFPLGYISDEQRIVSVYNAADVFILPSLDDNLPNTIMEAMACGLPCVGFKVGGIPEMIDHQKNGYVAQYKSTDDLEKGIQWVLTEADYETLSANAMKKVASAYSQQSVAMRYINVYHDLMAQKQYFL